MTTEKTALEKLRATFPAKLVGKLPRITCAACSKKSCTEHRRAKCGTCQNYITTAHMHLDYVGHAEVTHRLLDVDPLWSWEPLGFDSDGLPKLDASGGLWIRLTVHDDGGQPVTRLGYGDAPGKGTAVKELIGDAIRNAAMRFGVALDLWSKERDDYIEEEGQAPAPKPAKPYSEWLAMIVAAPDLATLTKVGGEIAAGDISDDDRKALRAEFTTRMHELKGAAA